MRIYDSKEDISYDKTKHFFEGRINRYNKENPYTLTMYQDNNPDLVKARNKEEMSILIPKLELDSNSSILDIACGIGRWSDAITMPILKYCGIDFCKEFIQIAKERNIEKINRHFYVSKSYETETVLKNNDEGKFNRVLFVGCFLYLNDADVLQTMKSVIAACDDDTIICIREPIGINQRLTLKEQFSDELKDEYNAIYRTRDEFIGFFASSLFDYGFQITEENFLFENKALNNRKETAQYYFILKR